MTFARVLGTGLAALSLGGSLVLAIACSPERPAFRGTESLPLTMRAGDRAHVTLVATRAAIDQAGNGMVFRVATSSGGSPTNLSVVPDDPSLDELFGSSYGSVSATDLQRICPPENECLIGVTLMQGAADATYTIRFGLESYGGFSGAAAAAAELD